MDEFTWIDFEPEPDGTGDGSGDPNKHILTILDPDGDEFAIIVHRVSAQFPLDGPVANEKRERAAWACNALSKEWSR